MDENSQKTFSLLIVDDEPKNIQLAANMLGEYDIEFATSGEEALEWTNSRLFDLILLDIMMPGMDGFEVCKRLKADERTKNIPVIFVTAKREEDDEFKGLDLGAIDYITKPIKVQIVRTRVENHLKLQSLMQDLAFKNEALKNANEELVRVNELKNKFLRIAAHDLRTPLGGIVGLSQLLLRGGMSDEKRHGFLSSIKKISVEMLTMLDDLLDISIIESGKLEIQLQLGSMERLIEDRLNTSRIIAEKKGISVKTDFSETPHVQFDPARMSQVLDNLIGNAIKFAPPDSTICVSLVQAGNMIKVSVRDEGPGILPEDRDKMFGEFQRLSAQPSSGEKSTGLGLAIVKKIVTAHNGHLEVVSEPGQGAEFSFLIPV